MNVTAIDTIAERIAMAWVQVVGHVGGFFFFFFHFFFHIVVSFTCIPFLVLKIPLPLPIVFFFFSHFIYSSPCYGMKELR